MSHVCFNLTWCERYTNWSLTSDKLVTLTQLSVEATHFGLSVDGLINNKWTHNTEYRIYIKLFLVCVIKHKKQFKHNCNNVSFCQWCQSRCWQNEEINQNMKSHETSWNLLVKRSSCGPKGRSWSPSHRTNSRENKNFEREKKRKKYLQIVRVTQEVPILSLLLATRRTTERFSRMWRF